ncbi:VWA domain-containing protein [Paenibacillus psychroresistens]|uniref:VWA domain-containing protein n=1 Tax=Paenibacillus psychroresistens TaxID=1778678 RepID=A0A6B8RYT9_9BACL|nr:VWA domain-containing protein [Paenibacillus psychroresistens]
MQFTNWYFLLCIPVLIYIFTIFIGKKKHALKFSSVQLLKSAGLRKTIKHKIGKYIILAGLILLIAALARPQLPEKDAPVQQKGIDISLVLDVSGSMQSVDFEPNRLEVARHTLQDFVDERPQDRLSFIVFAGTAYTRVPLTLDHNIIKESLGEVSSESVNEEGTAIGMAISVGLNRLKKSEAASKILILVTDGDNNAGTINPDTASELAKDMGVKIYTIGVGTDKTIIPVQDAFGGTQYQQSEGGLNEPLLQKAADVTGGQYYRAKDSKALSQIFTNINMLEKSEFNQDNFHQYTELAFMLIQIALILLLAGIFLDRYYYIQVP